MVEIAGCVVVALALAAIGLVVALVGCLVKGVFHLALLPLALVGGVIKVVLAGIALTVAAVVVVAVGIPLLAGVLALALPVLLLAGLAWAAAAVLGWLF